MKVFQPVQYKAFTQVNVKVNAYELDHLRLFLSII